MPLKVLLVFRSESPIKVSQLKPKTIHGLFFGLLKEETGELFHSGRVKPFSLFFTPYFRFPEREVSKFTVELNLLDISLFRHFSNSVLIERRKNELNVEGVPVSLVNVKPLSVVTYSSLLENAAPGQDFVVDFLTPTSFKRGKFDYILPEPELLFKSLLRKWNAFSPEKIGWELLDFVRKHVFVSGLWINSYKTEISEKAKIVGFRGRVYFYSDRLSEETKLLRALLKFSEFSGVGRKSTMGFGKTRLEEKSEAKELI